MTVPGVVSSTLYVRNKQPGPTVLSIDPKGSSVVEWGGAGDPNGADIQLVPEDVSKSVPFVRALSRGILEIVSEESDPALADALERQAESWRSRLSAAESAASTSIDRETNRDFVTFACLGPNSKNTGTCGADVALRETEVSNHPPLCDLHKDLEPQFVPEVVQEGAKAVTKWNRVVIGDRERATT